MKAQNKTTKSNFWKKLFIKICRIFDFEIIDQSNLYLPVTNKKSTQNLSVVGKQSIILPMGKTKITRSIKSLDIILRTCSSVNMLSQSKKRVFASSKSEYSLRTLNSIINSINNNKKIFKNIKLKLTIIDHNSDKKIIQKFEKILKNQFFKSEINQLDINFYKKKINRINQQGIKVTNNQISNMSNINQSLNLGKNCDDLVYFVEDDYLHKIDAIEEMLFAYEKISTQTRKELILCPADYPYLYTKLKNSKILLGNKYHWRTIEESLCTFLTSKKIINKYFKKFTSACEFEHYPFEKPFHEIYKKELCISPVPAIAVHYTNINSVYGLSPLINYKELWEKNKL
ncbi:glycosyltransferase family 2 protein [Candidatus Pelagibacter sp.]|nr:glycosyltransferase family 2 protein [Candidatus Pelagibacter sp.]